ncbi:MAG: DUF6537 domain-containing protein, partial [Xanthobacteraceae bacterium]
EAADAGDFHLPAPERPPLAGDYAILITGVGGTGVVTIGALIAMAAHLEGKAAAVIDMAGLAQKGGPVTSHVRLAAMPTDIKAIRVSAAGADLVLGCDMVVAGAARSLAAIDPGRTAVLINTHETYPGSFTHDPDYTLPSRRIIQAITARAGAEKSRFIDATRMATALMGDSIATNMFMLGLACQAGTLPLGHDAIERAIEINGVEVAMNKAAFAWGRRAAIEPEAVTAIAERRRGRPPVPEAETLDDLLARRVRFLAAYHNDAYGQRYAERVAGVREAEARVSPGRADLAQAVAVNLFKLMAVKDEYEVARLYSDGTFLRQLAQEFAGWDKLEFHLAPPVMARRDPATGHLVKGRYGPWMMSAFRLLARLRWLRGTKLDPFGYSAERRAERRLLADYEATVATIRDGLSADNHLAAVALAHYPDKIRGFGHVKAVAAARAAAEATIRREAFLNPRIKAEAAE